MSKFKDKVVWITGASSGIGEALAGQLARAGARLVLSARRETELKRVASDTALPELDLMILPFDLADTSRASGLAAQVMNKFGRIDFLINNGGFSQRSEAMSTAEEVERQIIEVNYFSAVNLSKAVLPYMIRQKSGNIVVVSSIAGKFGFFLRSSYSAAKHALYGYFESLRLEVEKKGIHILIVSPGKIRTEISLNAVAGDGSAHGLLDPSHEHAMTADECAEKIIRAITNERKELLVGGKEVLLVKIKSLFPRLFNNIIRKQSPF
jgi:dehydrogenase/reductase SDR family member 7B